jgi:hypothetical protein
MNMTRSQALALLQLEEGATDADVNRAFRKLALKHHPDKIGGDGSAFKEFGCARDILVGRQVPRPSVPASDEHRFVVYRVVGLTSWRARRVYIGLVDTAVKSLATRMKEHRSRGSRCAAWLRAVPEQSWKRIDSAPTMLQGLKKEAVHTGWELVKSGYDVVRGACVVIVTEKHAKSKAAWARQIAAARELSVLPNDMESALTYLRSAKAKLPQDIVRHVEGRCYICNQQGHLAYACPTQTSEDDDGTWNEPTRRSRKKAPRKRRRSSTSMKAMKKKKSGAKRAKEARDRGDAGAADKIRYGKKGRASSRKISNKNYSEKLQNKTRKKTFNKENNKKQSVKDQKKLYDQSDAAKKKRREREKNKRQ